MSEEEEFDSEKTQFWLPGQALPGRASSGDATGEVEGINLSKSSQRRQTEPAPNSAAGTAGKSTIDFDLTGAETAGSSGLDFDLTGETETGGGTMDFDITGEGEIPQEPKAEPARQAKPPGAAATSHPKATRAPTPPASSSASSGTLLLVAIIVIAVAVVYFVTR
jgi:hypothetical protein